MLVVICVGGPLELEHKQSLPIMSLARTVLHTHAATATATATATCRFCHTPITPATQMRSPLAREAVFKDAVCQRKTCVEKVT